MVLSSVVGPGVSRRTRVLQARGYTVLEASDGHHALQLAARHSSPIHLLLSDVVLPDVSATALADSLKRRRPEVRSLFMSGYTHEMVVQHGVVEGRASFLQKPFGALELAQAVRAVLDEQVVVASWSRQADRASASSRRAGESNGSRRPRAVPEPRALPAAAICSPAGRSRPSVGLKRAAAELDDPLPDGIRRSS